MIFSSWSFQYQRPPFFISRLWIWSGTCCLHVRYATAQSIGCTARDWNPACSVLVIPLYKVTTSAFIDSIRLYAHTAVDACRSIGLNSTPIGSASIIFVLFSRMEEPRKLVTWSTSGRLACLLWRSVYGSTSRMVRWLDCIDSYDSIYHNRFLDFTAIKCLQRQVAYKIKK